VAGDASPTRGTGRWRRGRCLATYAALSRSAGQPSGCPNIVSRGDHGGLFARQHPDREAHEFVLEFLLRQRVLRGASRRRKIFDLCFPVRCLHGERRSPHLPWHRDSAADGCRDFFRRDFPGDREHVGVLEASGGGGAGRATRRSGRCAQTCQYQPAIHPGRKTITTYRWSADRP
jgi:hypothetical protein